MSDSCDIAADNGCECGEFLTETDRNGILKLGSAHFDNAVKSLRFFFESNDQSVEAFEKGGYEVDDRHFTCGGDNVVGGLTVVDVIVGMYDLIITLFAAENFDCAVSDNFVRIHVCGRACAALDGINDKRIHQSACDDLVASCRHSVHLFIFNGAHIAVDQCASFFDLCHIFNKKRVKHMSRDFEVFRAAESLYAVIRICGDFQITDRVMFNSQIFIHNAEFLSYL